MADIPSICESTIVVWNKRSNFKSMPVSYPTRIVFRSRCSKSFCRACIQPWRHCFSFTAASTFWGEMPWCLVRQSHIGRDGATRDLINVLPVRTSMTQIANISLRWFSASPHSQLMAIAFRALVEDCPLGAAANCFSLSFGSFRRPTGRPSFSRTWSSARRTWSEWHFFNSSS